MGKDFQICSEPHWECHRPVQTVSRSVPFHAAVSWASVGLRVPRLVLPSGFPSGDGAGFLPHKLPLEFVHIVAMHRSCRILVELDTLAVCVGRQGGLVSFKMARVWIRILFKVLVPIIHVRWADMTRIGHWWEGFAGIVPGSIFGTGSLLDWWEFPHLDLQKHTRN